MCTIVFEEVVCRSGHKTRNKYSLVLSKIHGRQRELRSTYQRSAVVFGWRPPFEDPIYVKQAESTITLEIQLLEKRWRDFTGRTVCCYTLNLAQDCQSTTFHLQATNSSIDSPPELSVTVTIIGLRVGPERNVDTNLAIPGPSITNEGSAQAGSSDVPNVNHFTAADSPIFPSSSIIPHPSPAVPLLHISVPEEPEEALSSSMSGDPKQNVRETMYADRTRGVSTSLPASGGLSANDGLLMAAQDASRTASQERLSIESRSRAVSDTSVDAMSPSGELEGERRMFSGVSRLDSVVEIIDAAADIHPLVKGAWSLLNVAYTLAKQQSDLDTKIEDLVHALDANCEFAKILADNEITGVAESIVGSILREVLNGAALIKDYCGVRKSKTSLFKFVGSGTSNQVDACLEALDILRRDLGDHITAGIHQDLHALAATLSSDLSTLKAKINRIDNHVQAREYQELLGEMQFAPEADRAIRSDDRGCLLGTRGEIIEAIVQWAIGAGSDPSQSYVPGLRPDSRVLWLCGVAGSGKSSIAISVARALRSMDRLGALYGFEAAQQHNLQLYPTNLFSTIARQLARRHPRFGKGLIQALGRMDHDSRATTSVADQFKHFLVSPSSEGVARDEVIIIDAFDEAGSPEDRKAALHALSSSVDPSAFPTGLRFIVTSRYDPDIAECLERLLGDHVPESMVSVLRMDQIQSEHTHRDIEMYVRDALHDVFGLKKARADGDDRRLARVAKDSFLWASTACRFITAKDDRAAYTPAARLKDALNTGGGLDDLYRTILDQRFASSITEPSEALRTILGTLVCSFEPVSVTTICALAGVNVPEEDFDAESYQIIVRNLASLITGTHDPTVPLIPLHTSFIDFLRDSERSQAYAVAWSAMHLQLSMASFSVMKKSLRFNICGLESSFWRNADVADLDSRIKAHVSDELSYACRFWPAHVAAAFTSASEFTDTEPLSRCFVGFLKDKMLLLEWLEVMSLTKTDAQQSLTPLFSLQTDNSDLADLINFATYFAAPINTSVAHIYLSALAFTPSSSLLAPISRNFPNLVHSSAPLASWPQVRHSFTHALGVSCLAFSPNGKFVVTGESSELRDHEDLGAGISLWDPYSGKAFRPRLSTPSDVLSISVSPTGDVIASGHRNGTIQLWDAHTMSTIDEPLEGHTDRIHSVAFSPDGSLLASGSNDKTIRLWDPRTRSAVGKPLQGHEGWVVSVAFLPNGTLLASGSGDQTVRLWDVRTRSAVGNPLRGHAKFVTSVAFSPNGTLLASSSADGTIRLWDVQRWSIVGAPIIADEGLGLAVAFSPDGTRLASCSGDKTVRVWDIGTQTAVGDPLTGHTVGVRSVAFLPDGELLVSGSPATTLRVWDARALAAHQASRATSFTIGRTVACAPDAKFLASDSADGGVHLWDARKPTIVGKFSNGYNVAVCSIAFSPDNILMASGALDGTIRLWDVITRSPIGGPLGGHPDMVRTIMFSPDGALLASGSNDGTVILWDVQIRSVLVELAGHSGFILCFAFSQDSTLLASGSSDKTIRLWDVRTCSGIGRPLEGHSVWVRSLAFSPNCALLASGANDCICLWDVQTQTATGERLAGHASSVNSLSFSADSALLASCNNRENAVRIWDVRTQPGSDAQVARLSHHSNLLSIAFSPGTFRLTSSTVDGAIHTWEVRSLSIQAADAQTTSPVPESLIPNPSSLPPSHAVLLSLPPDCLIELDDGWVVGPNKELIVWTPPVIRPSLSNVLQTERFGGFPIVKLDFSDFVCGSNWTECYHSSASSVLYS